MKEKLTSAEKYYNKKFREIDAEIAIAVGAASIISGMTGKTTDSVINARDRAISNVRKIVVQIMNRVGKEAS